ncbi:hypothetical protein ACIOD2_46595 [Amycolatopsis sp. NPDC088138]|uniref:hypothetical protein n=1 Tax=Amycolatopsis sp. NPDC088138 TaxID=3363938 RepID=UPI0037F2695C
MSRMLNRAPRAAVIGVVLCLAGAGTASASAQARDGYPCQQWHFCGWDTTGPNPTGFLVDISGTIPCGITIELPSGVRNRLGSINNMTSGTWELKDGSTVRFTANETSWGNLPAGAQNNVDNLRFICT